jgi:hypothetical protein
MRPVVVIVILPLPKLVVEEVNIVRDAPLVQEPIALLVMTWWDRSTLPFRCGVRGRM